MYKSKNYLRYSLKNYLKNQEIVFVYSIEKMLVIKQFKNILSHKNKIIHTTQLKTKNLFG